MNEMKPPKVPEKETSDLGDGGRPPPSMDIVTGGDDGHTRETPPSSEGASYGGPAYPIDTEEAAFARDVRMLEWKARKQAAEDALARGAPAFGAGGGDSDEVTMAGATTPPAVTDEAAPAGKIDKKVSAIKVSILRHKMDICGVCSGQYN